MDIGTYFDIENVSYVGPARPKSPYRLLMPEGSSDLKVLVVDDDFMVATIHAELVDETPDSGSPALPAPEARR